MKKDEKGFNCETCNQRHEYPFYVYAHTLDVLNHTCDKCGAVHSIVMLTAKQKKKGKVRKTA